LWILLFSILDDSIPDDADKEKAGGESEELSASVFSLSASEIIDGDRDEDCRYNEGEKKRDDCILFVHYKNVTVSE